MSYHQAVNLDPFLPMSAFAGKGKAIPYSPRQLRRKWTEGTFPAPINLGSKLVWRESTIREWMEQKDQEVKNQIS